MVLGREGGGLLVMLLLGGRRRRSEELREGSDDELERSRGLAFERWPCRTAGKRAKPKWSSASGNERHARKRTYGTEHGKADAADEAGCHEGETGRVVDDDPDHEMGGERPAV